jgi:hypothetical protein
MKVTTALSLIVVAVTATANDLANALMIPLMPTNAIDRRNVLNNFVDNVAEMMVASAFFSNPQSAYGASSSSSSTGSVKALVPIVTLRNSLKAIEKQLQNGKFPSISSIPMTDREFKQLFDAYSDKVSYKQKFLDQNAFLVYYTKGFDGPGRPNIEEDINERQTIQFGLRNEAWINWNNFVVELQFADDADDNDLQKYLQSTLKAVNEYLQLVPEVDLVEAENMLKK